MVKSLTNDNVVKRRWTNSGALGSSICPSSSICHKELMSMNDALDTLGTLYSAASTLIQSARGTYQEVEGTFEFPET